MTNDPASSKTTLHYRLRPNPQGIRLDIWEDRPDVAPGQASYSFFVTYQLNSADEAQVVLDRYLIANDIYDAVPSNEAVIPIHMRTLVGSQSVGCP